MKEILISEIELTESDVIIFYLTPFVTSDKKVHRFADCMDYDRLVAILNKCLESKAVSQTLRNKVSLYLAERRDV